MSCELRAAEFDGGLEQVGDRFSELLVPFVEDDISHLAAVSFEEAFVS